MSNSLKHIRRVDIEFQSYCNRKCDWCPNKEFDRDFKEYLKESSYIRLLLNLKSEGFGSILNFQSENKKRMSYVKRFTPNQPKLSFLGYQEAFGSIDIFKDRVNSAYSILPPNVELLTNSNGDFISKDSLLDLPLTTLSIMDYDSKGRDYWREKLKELDVLIIEDVENRNELIGIHENIGNVRVSLNWVENWLIEDRGGSLKKEDLPDLNWKNNCSERIVPCPEPTYYINISYDGSVMPCCHLRPDNPKHKEFILGNINDDNIKDIYYSEKAIKFRKQLQNENGDYPEPCKHCQKVRATTCIGDPEGFEYYGEKYKGNKINKDFKVFN